VSVPPPPVPGGLPPVGQPDPYGPPPVTPPGYGQAPGQFVGQQPGQYGQPPVYGQAPGQPGNYVPAPGQPYKPKKSKALYIRLGIFLVIAAVAATFAIIHNQTSPDSSAAGDCLAIPEFKKGVEPDKAACDAPNANVKIGARLDSAGASCPTGDYDEYSVSGSTDYKLCLTINAKEGDCLADLAADAGQSKGYEKVPCADPTAQAKLTKVVQGTADKSACGSDTGLPVVYSQPPATMCFTATGH
jgi:hypothetical protein